MTLKWIPDKSTVQPLPEQEKKKKKEQEITIHTDRKVEKGNKKVL